MYSQVVRVAVHNNFYCTAHEYRQLDRFRDRYPDSYFFTNSNINTPCLLNICKHQYKAVITLNPNIFPDREEIKKLLKIDPRRIAFVRIKVLPKVDVITDLIKRASRLGYTVVLTLQRFNSIESVETYSSTKHYSFCGHGNRAHVTEKIRAEIIKSAKDTENTYICDERQLGCKGCGLCSKLTIGEQKPIKTLNLSSSGDHGICGFKCPDCYARTMQNFLRGKKPGTTVIRLDEIYANEKQAGRTAHIQMMIRKLEEAGEEINL